MTFTKKVAALVAAAAVIAGAGVAWAQTNQEPGSDPIASGDTRALGGTTPEATFVAITPCRIVDTRDGGGKLQLNTPRSFEVRGGGAGFAAQGGQAGGCNIPSTASSVEVTITAVESGSGFLRAWPDGGSQPEATFLNYTGVFNVSNTGSLKVCTVGCVAGDLRLRAFGTPTHVVVDVQGYYVQPMSAVMSAGGSRVRSNRTTAGTKTGTGLYAVTFERNVATCTMSATVGASAGGDALASGFASAKPSNTDANAVIVNTYATNGNLTDKPFHLQVFC
ncbi:hypothetical protein ACE2AJ_13085 [Aquihabitans daechungensis]|uniref:hypothetical protein n=1 Tax=Aquihabitans daechungensis TaxID=1052257 RepID=UPI003BA0A2AC